MSWGDARSLTVASGSRFITNPKHMPLLSVREASLNIKNTGTTQQLASVAGFWTALARDGATAAITVADTYVTVCSLSGAGFLFNVISTTHTAGFIPTFRITVDGTQYVIAPSANQTLAWRMVLGAVTMGTSIAASTTAAVAGDIIVPNGSFDAAFPNAKIGGVRQYGGAANDFLGVPSETAIMSNQLAMLRFESSLVVEVKCNLLSGTANDKNCGATYKLDV
jgi:hypothetical protein